MYSLLCQSRPFEQYNCKSICLYTNNRIGQKQKKRHLFLFLKLLFIIASFALILWQADTKKIFEYIEEKNSIWERKPIERLAKDNQLNALKFDGFWYAMDTLRDKIYLEDLWNSHKAPWKLWNDK
jgi:hypothetical protein